MSQSTVSGHFIDGGKGRIFVLLRRPVRATEGCVLVVPPFGEEMNKCRRMVTEMACGLAARGIATIVPDLYGTGDSDGDFADGDWETWLGDLGATGRWATEIGCPATALVAIRLGCALSLDCLRSGQLLAAPRAVLWQPVFDGGRFLSQFLRLRVAAGLTEEHRETITELKGRMAKGEVIDVAGYGISGKLAAALEEVRMPDALPATLLGEISWFEVVRDTATTAPPPSLRVIENSRAAGVSVSALTVVGEPFWSATEIVVNRSIVSQTIERLCGSESRSVSS